MLFSPARVAVTALGSGRTFPRRDASTPSSWSGPLAALA